MYCRVSRLRIDTAQLLDMANAVLNRVQDMSTNLPLVPVGSRDIPLKTVEAYKELRFNAITVFGTLLKKDAKFRVVVRDWLTEGGVTDKYMLDSLIEPEDPYVRASRHRGSWAGFIHMASEWSSTFQGLEVVARLYDQFMADHPSLILVGGALTPRMCEVVTKDIRALAKANVEWPIFLITSPGGRVSVLAALDDVYLSHGFRGRTCWCIDIAASCGTFSLALGDHVDIWSGAREGPDVLMGRRGARESDADAIAMFHQVRGMMDGMVSLHDMDMITSAFRSSQTAVDARCITPNFEVGFARAGHGDCHKGFLKWVRAVVPNLLKWPIFQTQGGDPQTPGVEWTEDRLVDHYMQFDPYSTRPRPGGIMEVSKCCCLCVITGVCTGHIFSPR